MKHAVRHMMMCLGIIAILSGCSGNQTIFSESDPVKQADLNGAGAASPGGREDTVITVETEADPDAEPQFTDQQAVLLFAGDILLSQHVLNAYQQAGGIHGVLDEGYRNYIDAADSFIANQEFPFSERGSAAADKEFTFRLAPEKVSLFQEMKLDIVTLANNHALDYGREALADTLATLDQAGIAHVGAGNDLDAAKAPVIKELNGIKVGVLGATRVIPVADWRANRYTGGMLVTYDPAELLEAITELRKDCDYLVVYVHWGIERSITPETYQRDLGQQYIDAGADLVVGSHPHVLQGIEYYQGKPIVYSLGNFVFGSSIPQTAMLQVELKREDNGTAATLSLIPGTSAAGHTRTISEAGQVNAFYQQLEGLSPGVAYEGDSAVRSVVQTE